MSLPKLKMKFLQNDVWYMTFNQLFFHAEFNSDIYFEFRAPFRVLGANFSLEKSKEAQILAFKTRKNARNSKINVTNEFRFIEEKKQLKFITHCGTQFWRKFNFWPVLKVTNKIRFCCPRNFA
uniref:Uncharacterized protein n=1 Tax=Lygus hesperus TaxID=30085 RepID=A0A146L7B0_LYGHE